MMKKVIAAALCLALICSLTAALAWSCPSCGNENGGKFCTECGTKKPANVCPSCGTDFGEKLPRFCTECGSKLENAAPAATPAPTATPVAADAEEPMILYASQTSSGAIGIIWENKEDVEYTVEYILRQSDNPHADREANGGFNTLSGKNSLGLSTCSSIIPGEDYWIGLFDEQGRGHYMPFEGNPVTQFTGCTISTLTIPQRSQDGAEKTASFISLEELEGGINYGLYFCMFYSNPGEEKEYSAHLILEAPNGARYPLYADVTFAAQTDSSAGWSFRLTDYFAKLKKGFGAIPVGDYKVSLYLDMAYVDTKTFAVKEKPAAAATPTPEPTKAPVLFDELVANADGSLTVSWTGGEAPYTLQYTPKRSDDFFEDRSAARTAGSYWTASTEIQEHSYTLSRLVPGEQYWIAVIDATENGRYILHTPKAAEAFDDFDVTLSVIPRSRVGETLTNLSCIPTDIAGVEDDTEHGAYIYLNYSNPGEPREALYQLALVLPNGELRVDNMLTVTLASGEDRWLGWNFYSLEWYLKRVHDYHGALPEGDVTVRAYLDGELAGEAILPFRTPRAVNIETIMDLGNGKHLLSWEDNGNGPYKVCYIPKFSDDMEADRLDERSSGAWIDASNVTGTSVTMEYLMPGTSYWITVTDSTDMVGVTTYHVPEAATLDLGVSFSGNFRRRVNDEVSDIDAFSAAEISKNDDVEYGLYLEMTYNERTTETVLPAQLVMTLPNGVAFCIDAFDMTWFEGDLCYWDFFTLDWALNRINSWYNGVPTGTYEVSLYSEGDYAGGFTFSITE